MNVSIVIVSYNTHDILKGCIESILKNTLDLDYEIIVVDNCSTDGTWEYLEELEKNHQVIAIRNKKNEGFSRANAIGIQYARGDYFCFLNSDTMLLNNAIKIFFDYAEKGFSEKGILGAYLKKKDYGYSRSFGNFPTKLWVLRYTVLTCIFSTIPIIKALQTNYINKKNIKYEIIETKDVEYICGACLFMNKDLYKLAGGFDGDYFLFFEETQLQLNLAKIGKIRRIIAGPSIIHLEGSSSLQRKKRNLYTFREYLFDRSLVKYIEKNMGHVISRIVSIILFMKYLNPLFLMKFRGSIEPKKFLVVKMAPQK